MMSSNPASIRISIQHKPLASRLPLFELSESNRRGCQIFLRTMGQNSNCHPMFPAASAHFGAHRSHQCIELFWDESFSGENPNALRVQMSDERCSHKKLFGCP